jgi:hypothetical protein
MKATATGVVVSILIIAMASVCFASNSRGYRTGDATQLEPKMALHIQAHNAKQGCGNLPGFSTFDDIVRQVTGAGDYDIFMVLFDFGAGFQGAEYGLIWPAGWGSGATTHCADFAIGDIVDPFDAISMTWSTCQSSLTYAPIAWTWVTAAGAGEIKITWRPGSTEPPVIAPFLGITDCTVEAKEWDTNYVYYAGVDVVPFDGPWEATEPTTWGGIKAMFR